jgi:hypothetical protein
MTKHERDSRPGGAFLMCLFSRATRALKAGVASSSRAYRSAVPPVSSCSKPRSLPYYQCVASAESLLPSRRC